MPLVVRLVVTSPGSSRGPANAEASSLTAWAFGWVALHHALRESVCRTLLAEER
jgi:hypothetical protein